MKKYRAFTLIEMLMALTVFSIGVLAVMRLITQNISSMDKAQSTTTATFLAKEGLELAYNMRDSNLQKGLPWNCVLSARSLANEYDMVDPDNACATYFSSGIATAQVFRLSFAPQGYFLEETGVLGSGMSDNFTAFQLSYCSGVVNGIPLAWYGYSMTGVSTQSSAFSRYLVFTGVISNQTILPMDHILKVESHVIYKKGASYAEVVLESFIGKQ